MGNLILAKSKTAAHPYYAHGLGINLYTAEELSYYIYNNLMIIEREFIDDRLLDFIRETGYEELAAKLLKWKDEADFWELLLVILQDVHYYSSQELESFRAEAGRIATEGYEAVMHEKARYMLSKGRFYDAITLFKKLLDGNNDYTSSKKVLSELYEGLGVAYARIFAYDRAIASFASAYEQTKAERFLREIYFAHLLSPKLEYPTELFASLAPGKLSTWAAEFEAAREQAAIYGKCLKTAALADKDERKKRSGYMDLIYEWTQEYRRIG